MPNLRALLLSLSVFAACGSDGSSSTGQCGNGVIERGEVCDDGNTSDGDGCSSQCRLESFNVDAAGLTDGSMGTGDGGASDATGADGNQTQTDGAVPSDVVINEFVFDHDGSDSSDFVEILGPASADLSHLTLVVIEGDDVANLGKITAVVAVGSTDTSGFFVTEFSSDLFQNDSQTLLLVDGFTGKVTDALDGDSPDGTLDVTPWTAVLDAVAVRDGGSNDLTYAGNAVLLPNFDGETATQPGGASRIPDGTDTGEVADWVRNGYDGEGLPCCVSATTPAGQAINTPGMPNKLQPE